MTLDQLLRGNLKTKIPGLDQLPDTGLTRRLTEYLLSCRVDNKSPKTLVDYCRFNGYFIRFLHIHGLDLPPASIHQNHFRLFLLSVKDAVNRYGRANTPETVNAYYRAVHSFFNWMEAEGLIQEGHNPFDRMPAPAVPKKLVKPWPRDIVQKLLDTTAVDKTYKGIRNRAMVLILFDTCVRVKELAGMKLSDMYAEHSLIRVMGKGSKERIVCTEEADYFHQQTRYVPHPVNARISVFADGFSIVILTEGRVEKTLMGPGMGQTR